jgi:hypothetical protein
MGYNPAENNLALALALQGASTSDGEISRLVGVARILEAVPDPDIDPGFAARLQARLMTEDLGLVLAVVPTPKPDEPIDLPKAGHRAAIIRLPRRRFVVRKAMAATIAAAMALALPVLVATTALPGSPGYGLKLRLEQLRIAAIHDPIARGFGWLDIADNRLAEATQLAALKRPRLIPATLALLQLAQRTGASLILEAATERETLARAAGMLQSQDTGLRDLLPEVPAATRDDVLDAIRTGQALSLRVAAALGLPMIRPPATVAPGAAASTPVDDSVPSDPAMNSVAADTDPSGSSAPKPPANREHLTEYCAHFPEECSTETHATYVSPISVKASNRIPGLGKRLTVSGCPDPTTCPLYELGLHTWPTDGEGIAVIDFSINTGRLGEEAGVALRNAAKTWTQANPNLRFSFTDLTGRTGLRGTQTNDGRSDIVWAPLDPGLISVASIRSAGEWIIEADITLNSLLPWSWKPCSGDNQACSREGARYDVQAIATHELGHVLCLGHPDRASVGTELQDPARDLTMYSHPKPGDRKQATLGLGDVLGIREAYPCGSCLMPRLYNP